MVDSSAAIIAVSPIVGSFLGVVIRRCPTGRPIALARSACDKCNHTLGPRDLIPLVSFSRPPRPLPALRE